MANASWDDIFTKAEVTFLPEREFDHSPIFLRSFNQMMGKKPFRFLNHWIRNSQFQVTVTPTVASLVYSKK